MVYISKVYITHLNPIENSFLPSRIGLRWLHEIYSEWAMIPNPHQWTIRVHVNTAIVFVMYSLHSSVFLSPLIASSVSLAGNHNGSGEYYAITFSPLSKTPVLVLHQKLSLSSYGYLRFSVSPTVVVAVWVESHIPFVRVPSSDPLITVCSAACEG